MSTLLKDSRDRLVFVRENNYCQVGVINKLLTLLRQLGFASLNSTYICIAKQSIRFVQISDNACWTPEFLPRHLVVIWCFLTPGLWLPQDGDY